MQNRIQFQVQSQGRGPLGRLYNASGRGGEEFDGGGGGGGGEYVDLWNALQTVDLALSISIIGGFGDSLPTQVNGL